MRDRASADTAQASGPGISPVTCSQFRSDRSTVAVSFAVSLRVAIQQASEACCGTGRRSWLSGELGFDAGRHPGVAIEETAERIDLGIPISLLDCHRLDRPRSLVVSKSFQVKVDDEAENHVLVASGNGGRSGPVLRDHGLPANVAASPAWATARWRPVRLARISWSRALMPAARASRAASRASMRSAAIRVAQFCCFGRHRAGTSSSGPVTCGSVAAGP